MIENTFMLDEGQNFNVKQLLLIKKKRNFVEIDVFLRIGKIIKVLLNNKSLSVYVFYCQSIKLYVNYLVLLDLVLDLSAKFYVNKEFLTRAIYPILIHNFHGKIDMILKK